MKDPARRPGQVPWDTLVAVACPPGQRHDAIHMRPFAVPIVRMGRSTKLELS